MNAAHEMGLAAAHHKAGRLAQAEALYRAILRKYPNHVEALHMLGVLARQTGNPDGAVELINRAVQLQPNHAGALGNLGNALKDLGRVDEALAAYRRSLQLNHNQPAVHNNLGSALKEKDCLADAVESYRHAIRLKPDFAPAYANLGDALRLIGQVDEALKACTQAVQISPQFPTAHCNLGNVLKSLERPDEAIASYRNSIRLQPEFAEAHYNLALALEQIGKLEEAVASLRQAIRYRPNFADAYSELGNLLKKTGDIERAIAAYQKAITLKPDFSSAQYNLGIALQENGAIDKAIEHFRTVAQLKPGWADGHNALGYALFLAGQFEEAAQCLDSAVNIDSAYAEGYSNLGAVLTKLHRFDDAATACRKAVQLSPQDAGANTNLANALWALGRVDETIELRQRVVDLRPDSASAHSSLILSLLYQPGISSERIRNELSLWNERHAAPLRNHIQSHENTRDPDRRLRIGYLSPDFRNHPVGQNMIPLLRRHNQGEVEIFCYSQSNRSDFLANQLRQYANAWRTITRLTDKQVVDQIRQDQIDILVDLALHTANNRLTVFARKPAPIQVTFAGYPGSTGLSTIDYRFTDPFLDPDGSGDNLYSEASVRLPQTFWCYDPLDAEIPVGPLPAESNGFVTFGCLCNFAKVNEEVLLLWARVLRSVSRSRLVLLCPEGSSRNIVSQTLERAGVSPGQIDMLGHEPRLQYLRNYSRIDVALDTFPYNGHTTSLDSLWMGVPVVTLVGQTIVGRAGVSQLSNLGLQEFIARSETEFIRIATSFAADIPRLSLLRSTLRDRMRGSPLMSAASFALSIETAYRQMWHDWCGRA